MYRLGLRDVGIDQLNFHLVQLGYLKFLQMGNTDPNKTKVGNKYEVKPHYEELSKQINMQHAINQCYECMSLSKEISQLDRCNNRQIITCRLYTTVYQPGNHRSVIIGARQPITARRLKPLKQSLKYKGLLTQTFTLTEGSQISRHEDTRQLRVPPPALIQGSKRVSNERAKQGESSATKNVKSRSWNRRKMAIESDGEQ
ncbi:scopoletin glucosyltransferase [Dorcoceras hygrometricum]|uniref:Scopoletin glucosyltransferase n=1 Tax=Dorcoceras hygrometricum TaxID=472368 RepID=A0A2Z7AML5_9LAMI|nr:scopoletin glucosyltransferase [Dorcoceras hygrometricum]